jgi:hypothetical protein
MAKSQTMKTMKLDPSSMNRAARSRTKSDGANGAHTVAEVIASARKKAFTEENPATAFAHFRPLAEQLPAEDLPVFTGQALVLRANILRALDVIEPHLEAAVSALRDARLEQVFELPALSMGLEFAAQRVPAAKLSAGEIEKMLNEGAPARELMLRFLEVASHPLLGLLPRERVAAVRAGTGKLDQAQDFVAIPGLFAEFKSTLGGKHPFSPEMIERLGELGSTLIKHVRPGKANGEAVKRSPESILRDQFAAMVADRYDYLQTLAVVALGKRRTDELLPALRSSVGFGRAASPSDDVHADTAPQPAAPVG